MEKLIEKIKEANPQQIDASWAILKYKNMGILRKLGCFCVLLGVPYDEIEPSLEKDNKGRIYDKTTRHQIHDALISASQNK